MKRLWNQRRPDLLALAGFLILPLILYWGVTIGGNTMLPVDNLYQWAPWSSYAAEMGVEVPQNSLLSDLIIQNYAWKNFTRESIAAREIPLWSPNLFAGSPFLANGQNSTYYPFSILFWLLPLTKAFGWFTLSQLWLAGALAFVFGRVLGLRRRSAFVTGLIFQGSGFMLVSAAVFPMIIAAAVWLPLLLACLERLIRLTMAVERKASTFIWFAVGVVALGLLTLAGHPEILYYTLLIMGSYAAWRWLVLGWPLWREREWRRLGRPAGPLLALVLLGLMLGGIQFIPFYEVGQVNFREGANTLEEIRNWGFKPRRILTLLLPDFYGNPSHHDYFDLFSGETTPLTTNVAGNTNPHGAFSSNWGIKNYVEGGIYLGILPLLLAVIALWTLLRKAWGDKSSRWSHLFRHPVTFFAGLSFFSLAFIFGTPLYAILYYGLPFINQLHSPFRWVFPLSLCVAIMAGFGLEALGEWHDAGKSALKPGESRLADVALWVGFLGGGGVLVGLMGVRFFWGRMGPIVERLFLGLAQAQDAFPSAEAFFSYQARNGLILALGLIGCGVVILAMRRHWSLKNRPLWPILAAALIILDLSAIGYGFNASVDPDLLEFKPEMVSWLEENASGWRISSFAPKADKPFNANSGWLYGFEDVRGYDSVILKQYTDYMGAIEPQNELLFNRIQGLADWNAINSPLVDLLGVKYIITQETLDLPKLALAWEGEGARIYENLAVMPRAYVIPRSATVTASSLDEAVRQYDPRQYVIITPEKSESLFDDELPAFTAGVPVSAEIIATSNIEVTVRADVTAETGSWLILNDSMAPGWRAFVRPVGVEGQLEADEVEREIILVNGNFRGVILPEPGRYDVRFRYSPTSFLVGGLTSIMAVFILMLGTIIWLWRLLYDSSVELTSVRSVAKNSLAPMALNLFNRGIDFAFALFYLRLLGPADSGGYATAIVIAGIYDIIANFGLNTYLIREVSRDRQRASHFLLNTNVLRIGTGIMAAAPVLFYLWSRNGGLNLSDDISLAVLLLMVGMIFSGMGQLLAGLFYAFELAERPAVVTTITTIMKVALGVMVLLLGQGIVGLAAVSIIVNFVTLLILAVMAVRNFALKGPWRLDWPLQRSMISGSYPLMINHLLAVAFFQIDIVMMEQINGKEVTGWYSSAYKWVNAFNVIPSFFTFALFPIITRQVQESIDEARRTFRLSLKLLTLISLPLAASTMLAAPFLIGVLGGAEFLPAGAISLQLVIWSIPFGWLNSVTNYVLIALGLERIETRAFIIGVLFNVIGNLIFLRLFSYVAASITTIVSEIILLMIFNYYLGRKMKDVGWLKLLYRPVIAILIAMIFMLIGAQLHWLVGIAVGLPIYAAGLWLMRVFGEEEKRILAQVLPATVVSRLGIG